MSQPTRIKRKRSHDPQAEAEVEVDELKDESLAKQPRSAAPCLELSLENSQIGSEADEPRGLRPSKQSRKLSPSKDQLSENNLRIFNEEMNPAANNAPVLKRTSSRRSIVTSSEAETAGSQRSSSTTAYYRFHHLAAVDVYIHADPPDDIQAAIDHIVKAKVSEDRRVKLRDVAKEFYKACKEAVQATAGEDDFVDLFYTALKAIGPNGIHFRAKADWREELKPIVQRSDLNLSLLVNFNATDTDQQQEVDDASAPPPPKRQQQSTGQMYISPQPSITQALDSTPNNKPPQSDTMPPPTFRRPLLEKVKATFPIKTPRPDISIGAKEAALISALSSQHLIDGGAKWFLQELENTMVVSERRSAEPLLIAVPSLRASDLVFPFAVVEGKAYSTGKQVFEAQNQAAVSGASALKMQLSLSELVKRSTPSFDVPHPLFFSICTEGPYHELWAHYTHMEDNVRKFKMKLLQICNGVLLEGVEDFIVTVDKVLRWGTGAFLESVVERLGMVARKVGA